MGDVGGVPLRSWLRYAHLRVHFRCQIGWSNSRIGRGRERGARRIQHAIVVLFRLLRGKGDGHTWVESFALDLMGFHEWDGQAVPTLFYEI